MQRQASYTSKNSFFTYVVLNGGSENTAAVLTYVKRN